MPENLAHMLLVKTGGDLHSVWEAERRLREHGYTPERGDSDGQYMMIFWAAAPNADMSFLEPDFVPPK